MRKSFRATFEIAILLATKGTNDIGFYASWAWPANISQLQIQAMVEAGQTTFNISFTFIKLFSISSGPGRRNSNSLPG